MQNSLNRLLLLPRRWWWLVMLGVILCSGATYVVSKFTHPVYRATATLVVSFQTSPSSYDSIAASLAAVPTYTQLVPSVPVLGPVLAHHPGMTLRQLSSMITVTSKTSTQLIELDVDNENPELAATLANEICNSFVQYIDPQLAASIIPVYAVQPTDPYRPKPLQDAGLGALVGLGLALALIFLFEWVDDRLGSPEEIQELLGMETLTTIPEFTRKELSKRPGEVPTLTEAYRMLCASLDAAQINRPFKLVMVTSALPGEGKSTVAANLASFLALAGKRVLLVDADLRRPTQYQRFHLDNSKGGLSQALMQTQPQLEMVSQGRTTAIPTLRLLPAGTPSSNSAELLQSPRVNNLFEYFKKAPFDYVLFDTPPLLPVADAQLLASHVQATVIVVDASKTPRKILLRVKNVFNRTNTTVLGVAMNKCSWPEYGYIRDYQRHVQQPLTAMAAIAPPDTPAESLENMPTRHMPLTTVAENKAFPNTPEFKEQDPNSTTVARIKSVKQTDGAKE